MIDIICLYFYDYYNIVYKYFYEKNILIVWFWLCYVFLIWFICYIFNGNKYIVDIGFYINLLIKYLFIFVGNLYY